MAMRRFDSQARLFDVATEEFRDRIPYINRSLDFIAVDCFAGGGGASHAIQTASGRSPVLAVNHDPAAIAMHMANHPHTYHLCENVYDVHPREVAAGLRVDAAWFSPDCTHFSKAKGGKPRKKEIRGLAWIVVTDPRKATDDPTFQEGWANVVRPRVIFLENVEEFEQWGPLYTEELVAELTAKHRRLGTALPKHVKVGHPIPELKGTTFKLWVRTMEALGYVVEWRCLRACDYGAPTTRKRLFLVARYDGRRIVWPTATHAKPKLALAHGLQPYRPAADCINWDIPCPSIFSRKKPLADKTQARIAEGIRRYVLQAERPFLLNLTHGGRLEPIDEPFRTITAANRGEKALVAPVVASIDHQSSSHASATAGPDEPLSAITTKARHVLAAASLIQTRNGERKGQAPRTRNILEPLNTVTAQGSQGGLVSAWLVKHYGGVIGHGVERPVGSITGRDSHALGTARMVAKHVIHHRGRSIGRGMEEPMPTVTGKQLGVVASHLTKFYGTSTGAELTDPMPTVTGGGGHLGLVAAFIQKYYGAESGQHQSVADPLHTIVNKARFGLVTVTIAGEEYVLVDIGMRMLQPRELARAQGLPDEYRLMGTKTVKIAMIGNSVSPPPAQALVEAQFGGPGCPLAQEWTAAAK